MYRKSKVMIMLLILITSAVVFSGCGNKEKSQNNDENINKSVLENNDNLGKENSTNIDSATNTTTDNATDDANTKVKSDSEESSEKKGTTNTTTQDETTDISIYSIDEDSLETVDSVATIPASSEITPELIVNEVVKKFAEIDIIVGIDSIVTKDDAVIVSFKGDTAPIVNVSASIEDSILDAIGMSLIDNSADNYKKVIFRVEGKAYESENISLGIDEVYIED